MRDRAQAVVLAYETGLAAPGDSRRAGRYPVKRPPGTIRCVVDD